jgi:hypothetical protein
MPARCRQAMARIKHATPAGFGRSMASWQGSGDRDDQHSVDGAIELGT